MSTRNNYHLSKYVSFPKCTEIKLKGNTWIMPNLETIANNNEIITSEEDLYQSLKYHFINT